MFKKSIYIGIACIFLVSCNFFKETETREPIARVNDSYLYKDDVANLSAEGTSAEDSLLIVNNFITRWATQLLLIDGSERNLSEAKQEEFGKLVDQYKKDLYTKAYLEALVKKGIDTTVNASEATAFYEQNKETFKLNDELIMFRYISLPLGTVDKDDISKKFVRFSKKDRKHLDSISVQFRSFSLNDSIWVKASQVSKRIPIITPENKQELLKKSNFVQLKDSLGLYLMQIKDVRLRNDYAPLAYVIPTIKQIIINKRKLDLIKQLETDITKDAIKNDQFEIYTKQ